MVVGALAGLPALPAHAQAPGADTGCITQIPAGSHQRVALIVANSAYDQGWQPLESPQADRRALVAALARIGFATMELCNADRPTMRAALGEFARHAAAAEVAVVYFAGHGVEWHGTGYVAPLGTGLGESLADPPSTMLAVTELHAALAGARVPILLVDACRVEAAALSNAQAGSIANAAAFADFAGAVGFAAAYGHPAFDSAPPTYALSPYAQSLVEFMPVRGLTLPDFFAAVRADVVRRTAIYVNGPQEPWALHRGNDAYYFSPPDVLETASPALAASGLSPLRIDLQDLESGKEFQLATRLLADEGLPLIHARADGGEALAQYLLSYMLRFGVGVEADQERSDHYLQLAAAGGLAAAQTILGFQNQQYAQDQAREAAGQELLQRAASQDFGRAHYFLGDIARAAEDGDAYSAFLLADRGGADLDHGFRLLEGIAETGDESAEAWLCELAMIHARRAMAELACRNAADAGYAGAQAHMASLRASGAADNDAGDWELAHWQARGRRTIYFELDRFQPRGLNQQIVLDGLLAELARRPWSTIVIEGHTDQLPTREYSLGLGSRMAGSVSRFLEQAGISTQRMVVASCGSSRPVNNSFGIAPFNRRVEVTVVWGAAETDRDQALPPVCAAQ